MRDLPARREALLFDILRVCREPAGAPRVARCHKNCTRRVLQPAPLHRLCNVGIFGIVRSVVVNRHCPGATSARAERELGTEELFTRKRFAEHSRDTVDDVLRVLTDPTVSVELDRANSSPVVDRERVGRAARWPLRRSPYGPNPPASLALPTEAPWLRKTPTAS